MSAVTPNKESNQIYAGLSFFIVVFFYPGLFFWILIEKLTASFVGFESTPETRILGVVIPLFASVVLVLMTCGFKEFGRVVDRAWRIAILAPRKALGMKTTNAISRGLIAVLFAVISISIIAQQFNHELRIERDKPKPAHTDFFISSEIKNIKENGFDLVVTLEPKSRESIYEAYGFIGENARLDFDYRGLDLTELSQMEDVILSDIRSLLNKSVPVATVTQSQFKSTGESINLLFERHGVFGIHPKSLFVGCFIPLLTLFFLAISVGFTRNVSSGGLYGNAIGFLVGVTCSILPFL